MSFSELLNDKLQDFGKSIQLGLICKVEKFDKEKMIADVEPLLKSKDDDEIETALPIIPDIPVCFINAGGFYVRPEYKRGDLVWVSFSTHDIADALNEYTRAASKKIFSIENACLICGIASKSFINPAEFANKDGLLIGHKDGKAYIQFKDDEIIFNIGADVVKFTKIGIETKQGIKAGGEVTWNNLVIPTRASTHTHTSATPGSPTSPPNPGS